MSVTTPHIVSGASWTHMDDYLRPLSLGGAMGLHFPIRLLPLLPLQPPRAARSLITLPSFFINKKPIGGVRVAEIKRFVTHAHHETSDPRVCRSSHVTAACRVTRQSVSSPRSSGPARAVRGVL